MVCHYKRKKIFDFMLNNRRVANISRKKKKKNKKK